MHRILKPQGHFFLIIKNSVGFWPLHIEDIPNLSASRVRKDIQQIGFILQRQQGILTFPFSGKFFDFTDENLFLLKTRTGSFSLFYAEKKPFIPQTNESYNSARITKASVLTSPRT